MCHSKQLCAVLFKPVQILQKDFVNFYPRTIKTLRWNCLCSFEINLLSLCIHNPHAVLLISWCSFGGKTGIFASCVIYCGTHLHIKALISPSERESGNGVIIGRVVAGDESVFGSGGRPRGERRSLWVLVLTMRRVLVGFVFFSPLFPAGGWMRRLRCSVFQLFPDPLKCHTRSVSVSF